MPDTADRSSQVPAAGPRPFVSIVIPMRNEEGYLPQCTRSLRDLDYPDDRYEVIFADGRSTDRSIELAEAAGFTVVDNPGLRVATGREVGFAASRGDIVAFTDADCLFEADWLTNACRHFQDPDVAGLSGPTRVPEGQNAFGKAVGIVFGLAGAMGTTVHLDDVAALKEVNDLPGCNCFYRRSVLESVMPMNTGLDTNEDVEMNAHIRRRGHRLWMTPDVVVHHYKRTAPKAFCRQMYRFARDRAKLSKWDRRVLGPGHLAIGLGVPLALLVVVLLGWLVGPLVFVWAGLGGAAIAVLVVVAAAARYGAAVGLNLLLALSVMALVWPAGFLRGAVASSRDLARPGTPPTV